MSKKFLVKVFDWAYIISKSLSIVFRALIAVIVLFVFSSYVVSPMSGLSALLISLSAWAYTLLPFFAIVRNRLNGVD